MEGPGVETGAIENLELWQELDREALRHRVSWEWVKGHAGHPRNEYANDLAVLAATELGSSGGFVESGFEAWLRDQQERKGRYRNFDLDSPPPARRN